MVPRNYSFIYSSGMILFFLYSVFPRSGLLYPSCSGNVKSISFSLSLFPYIALSVWPGNSSSPLHCSSLLCLPPPAHPVQPPPPRYLMLKCPREVLITYEDFPCARKVRNTSASHSRDSVWISLKGVLTREPTTHLCPPLTTLPCPASINKDTV